MKWHSVLSQSKSVENAVRECLNGIHKKLGNSKADFVTLFVSPHFEKEYKKIHQTVSDAFLDSVLMGCCAGGIIGEGKEVENHPAISIAAARLPGVKIRPFKIDDEDLPDLDSSPKTWEKLIGIEQQSDPQFILLADPFSMSVENFILGLDYAYPKSVKIGGLASGANAPGRNALFLNDKLYNSGLVGAALTGDVCIDALVAQGCRPIGRQMQITACDQNILLELDGQPPLVVFQEIFQSLNERDKMLAQQSLFLGITADAGKSEPGRGDFLIRNIIGADSKRGVLVVGSFLRVGQTVQFHLRDDRTSHEDLEEVLSRYKSRTAPEVFADPSSKGVLLFSCLGRGTYLYNQANHDSDLFSDIVGDWPITGFFCNGEIGPVGPTTFLHGYTSCFGIIRPRLP